MRSVKLIILVILITLIRTATLYADTPDEFTLSPTVESNKQLKSLIVESKWEKAKALVSSTSKHGTHSYWLGMLCIADGYYAWGKYKESRKIYDAFVDSFPDRPPEEFNALYVENTYKYAQLLVLLGDKNDAVRIYTCLFKAKMPRSVSRQVCAELIDLLVWLAKEEKNEAKRSEHIKSVRQLCSRQLWIMDIWFLNAATALAYIEYLEGKPEKADKILKDLLMQPNEGGSNCFAMIEKMALDNPTLQRINPLPHYHFLTGLIKLDKANKLIRDGGDKILIKELLLKSPHPKNPRVAGAYYLFTHINSRHAVSKWNDEAKIKAEEVKKLLKEHLDINILHGNALEFRLAFQVKGKPPISKGLGGSYFMRFPDGVKHWIHSEAVISDEHIANAEVIDAKEGEIETKLRITLTDQGQSIIKTASKLNANGYERLAVCSMMPHITLLTVLDFSDVLKSNSLIITSDMTHVKAEELAETLKVKQSQAPKRRTQGDDEDEDE